MKFFFKLNLLKQWNYFNVRESEKFFFVKIRGFSWRCSRRRTTACIFESDPDLYRFSRRPCRSFDVSVSDCDFFTNRTSRREICDPVNLLVCVRRLSRRKGRTSHLLFIPKICLPRPLRTRALCERLYFPFSTAFFSFNYFPLAFDKTTDEKAGINQDLNDKR